VIGLACKNAILIVEFARELHLAGRSVIDSALEASRIRLRPILMTSFAFIMGVLPWCSPAERGRDAARHGRRSVLRNVGSDVFRSGAHPVFYVVLQGMLERRTRRAQQFALQPAHDEDAKHA
jgi:multidrug efflux pump subunit AcrB